MENSEVSKFLDSLLTFPLRAIPDDVRVENNGHSYIHQARLSILGTHSDFINRTLLLPPLALSVSWNGHLWEAKKQVSAPLSST